MRNSFDKPIKKKEKVKILEFNNKIENYIQLDKMQNLCRTFEYVNC